MSNEAVVEDKVEETVETPEVVEVTLDVHTEKAMEQGWVPLEDWKASGRDEKEWRPAKEFVERGELYKSIHTTKKELKQTQAALDALARHHQYVFEKAHQQAIRDLRAEKRLAIRNDDLERLEEIETEIETITDQHLKEKQQLAVQQAAAVNAGPPPEFQVFLDRNPWYQMDKALRDEADAIGFVYLNNGGTKETLLGHVEKEMKKKFPEKFGVKRAAPNAVAGVSRSGPTRKASDGMDLSAEERQIMKTFVDRGIMTEAEYIKELKKVGR